MFDPFFDPVSAMVEVPFGCRVETAKIGTTDAARYAVVEPRFFGVHCFLSGSGHDAVVVRGLVQHVGSTRRGQTRSENSHVAACF